MARIIDGRAVARSVREGVVERVDELGRHGVTPGLAAILVGDHEPSRIYVRKKQQACRRTGIASQVHHLPSDTGEAELLERIEALNRDEAVHGILVQLPLPEPLRPRPVLEAIDPGKDVDGFHPLNIGRLSTGRPELAPGTPKGVMRLLHHHRVPLRGRDAVVLGRSRVVGRPMSILLLAEDATVTSCHRHTASVREHAARADVLVAAVGSPGLVRADWVKPGATVIDVGITRRADGSLAGDVAFDEVEPRAGLITPVPGGVGPMTIAMLLENTCALAEARAAARDHAG